LPASSASCSQSIYWLGLGQRGQFISLFFGTSLWKISSLS
jgi:hypothetical protein